MRDHVIHLRLGGANHLECRLAGERMHGWIAPGGVIITPAGSDMAKRYLATLKTQEDRLDKVRTAEEDARQKLSTAKAALSDAIAKLEL